MKKLQKIAGKTDSGLVKWCKKMVGHPYWYGTFCQTSSAYLYNVKKKQYPKMYQWKLEPEQLYTKVTDCVGLIKGYLMSAGWNEEPIYNKKLDVSADGMRKLCAVQPIQSIPTDVAGVLVFKKGHVGVYIGGGKVVEAKGHTYGVVISDLHGNVGYNWLWWGYCPFVEYTRIPIQEQPKNKKLKYYKKYSGEERYAQFIDYVFSNVGVPKKYRYSWKKRIPVAEANGIKNYTGTAAQNMKIINLAKEGKLIKA